VVLASDLMNGLLNPAILAVVGFFVLRLIRLLDDTAKAKGEMTLEIALLKKDLETAKDTIAVLKRDQSSIWQKIDLLKERASNEQHLRQSTNQPSNLSGD